MPAEAITGWDVGGAHLKAARIDASGVRDVVQLPCPLWQGSRHLEQAVRQVTERFGASPYHAVTMTGEMADLFANRREGVACIANTMQQSLAGAEVRIFAARRGFVEPVQAAEFASDIASANWYASAAWTAQHEADVVLIDVGSTTTDIVPIAGGKVSARGLRDAERLRLEELVYSGVARTSLVSVAQGAPFDGQWYPLMDERFATMADVYRLTGKLAEHADQYASADGAEKTPRASARRLARMIGFDAEDAPLAAWQGLADYFAARQAAHIERAVLRQLSRADIAQSSTFVGAGVGRFIVKELAVRTEKRYVDFAALSPASPAEHDWISNCAPAVAVALLMQTP
jgi:(4-(4-[2-(gamma-L-glutamylamino)ethyl]phenoxymethyl)furan-2-yl)methanamine synthase